MEIRTQLRRWGNSLGIIVPSDILRIKNLREGEEVIITVEKKKKIHELFGSLKGKKLNAQKIKDDIRSEEARNEIFS